MKNIFLTVSILSLTALTSCSSHMNKESEVYDGENRSLASKEFECHFSQMIDGKKVEFIFMPEKLKLNLNNETVYLEEGNFISGGFSYVTDKKEKDNKWQIKNVDFVSYADRPNIKIKFKRTPASSKEKIISQYCE